MVRHPYVVPQDLAAPTIVVPRNPQNLDAGIAQRRQFGQRPEPAAWNHVFPLEPKVKQITIDDQTLDAVNFLGEGAQISFERSFYGLGRNS
jgi:hypothetical protein